MTPRSVLLLEPYLSGSHRAWAEGYQQNSLHEVRLCSLPGRFWKWRMHGAAVTLSRRALADGWRPDVVLATDMLDLAAFLGLARHFLGGAAVALYMHENQLAYPALPRDPDWSASRQARAERQDAHYAFTNLTSALSADLVLWNSDHNRDSFLSGLPGFLRSFPDFREAGAAQAVAAHSRVLPVGLELASLDAERPAGRVAGRPRVLWNHRWEHDKAPEVFFAALYRLLERGEDFDVIVLGEAHGSAPRAFEEARTRLGSRLLHMGFVPDRAAYARWLWSADVVVSTANHEFFGTAVCEAVHCGCRPVLPRRLAYPEIVPRACHEAVLYDSFDDLLAKTARALAGPPDGVLGELRARVDDFDWRRLAPVYDEVLADLAGRHARAVELYGAATWR